MPKTIPLEVRFSQCVPEPPGCSTCQYFSWQKQSVLNQPRTTRIRQNMKYPNHSASHTFVKEHTLHVRLPPPPPETTAPDPVVKLNFRDSRAQSALCHTESHASRPNWNIKAVKSNEATRLPLEPCLSDPPLFQIIMSDSQMCPSLEMWLMSHLVSEDLGAGFERGIKGLRLLLRIWAVSVLGGKRVYVNASFRLLRLALICTAATFLRDWGGLGPRDGCYNSTVMLEREGIKLSVCWLQSFTFWCSPTETMFNMYSSFILVIEVSFYKL